MTAIKMNNSGNYEAGFFSMVFNMYVTYYNEICWIYLM